MEIQKFDYRCVGNFRGKGDLKAIFDHVKKTGRPLLIVDGRFEGGSVKPQKSKSVDPQHVVAVLRPTKPGDAPERGRQAGHVNITQLRKDFAELEGASVELWTDDGRKPVIAMPRLFGSGELKFVRNLNSRRGPAGHFELHPLTEK